jgi:hypothetical protein
MMSRIAVAAMIVASAFSIAGACIIWQIHLRRVFFELYTASLHLIGLTSQQVIAKLGQPAYDTSIEGNPTEDLYLVYSDPKGDAYGIRFRQNVAIGLEYDGPK